MKSSITFKICNWIFLTNKKKIPSLPSQPFSLIPIIRDFSNFFKLSVTLTQLLTFQPRTTGQDSRVLENAQRRREEGMVRPIVSREEVGYKFFQPQYNKDIGLHINNYYKKRFWNIMYIIYIIIYYYILLYVTSSFHFSPCKYFISLKCKVYKITRN